MNKADIIMAGAIIAILLGMLLYSTNAKANDISCGLFKSIDFILTDKQVDARISSNIIDRMGNNSISRCVASRSRDTLRRGARRFCRKKGKGKTPKGLTLDGFFWSTGELLKIQCIDDAVALINWDWVGNEER
jgi:hypothetical protein